MKKPVALLILDGYGHNEVEKGNAIAAAGEGNISGYLKKYPNTLLSASGMDVGLPDGQMGNSEVGHTNIGAGRIVYQELTRITKSINDGDFFEKKEFLDAVENCKKNNTALHLIGLLSDGGVHSHNSHLYALLKLAKNKGLDRVFVHTLLDGRDVPPSSGIDYIRELEAEIEKIGVGKIATVMGRYYAMDRDNRWERVSKAYEAMVLLKGETAPDAVTAVENSYKNEIVDEFVIPCVVDGAEAIDINSSVVFFNFRPDRAREITRVFVDPDFNGFERSKGYFPLYYVCFTQYDATMPNVHVAFKPEELVNTFGEIISKKGLKQLRIAETEKYAHVTFFFNGGKEAVYEGEDRCLIASPKVATYDLQPEMSAYEVKDNVIERIQKDLYDVIILNFANCDMVGHTGDFDAAVKAVKAVDDCVGQVVDEILKKDGVILITADHGNADLMWNEEQGVVTAHSTNPVPLIVIGAGDIRLKSGRISDLCPTMLDIMGLDKPEEMTGNSLIIK
ncbi:MAG: 2,3-bisphosphoglycerate-independent phosphoglycerate mutase [Ruminococcaceae bacterium]|nr:2,3-bisphosphoglycerate-independent phosphoglycerate mutase [Oscillospiraceae bacterium]